MPTLGLGKEPVFCRGSEKGPSLHRLENPFMGTGHKKTCLRNRIFFIDKTCLLIILNVKL